MNSKYEYHSIRRVTRHDVPQIVMCFIIDAEEHEVWDLGDPLKFNAALLDLVVLINGYTARRWEMQSMIDNGWIWFELPPNGKIPVGSMWLFKKRPTWMEMYTPLKLVLWQRAILKPQASGSNVTSYLLAMTIDHGITHSNVYKMFKSYLGYVFCYDSFRWMLLIFLEIQDLKIPNVEVSHIEDQMRLSIITKVHFTPVGVEAHAKVHMQIAIAKSIESLKVLSHFRANVHYLREMLKLRVHAKSTTAMSAIEAEYIAASEVAMEAVWIRKFTSGLVVRIGSSLAMYQSTLFLHWNGLVFPKKVNIVNFIIGDLQAPKYMMPLEKTKVVSFSNFFTTVSLVDDGSKKFPLGEEPKNPHVDAVGTLDNVQEGWILKRSYLIRESENSQERTMYSNALGYSTLRCYPDLEGVTLWIQNHLLDYGYALTINPTCIEQFWATVKVKTINGEVQLQALVDGKKIIITESTVRRDLQLEDAEGVDCLPNFTIFEQLTLIGSKITAWNEFSSTMAFAIICLATNQKFNFSKYIFESMVKNLDNADNVADEAVNEEMDDSLERAATTATSLDAEQDKGNINKTQSKATPNEAGSQGTTSGGGPRRQETMGDTIAQTRFENVYKTSNDPLLARGNTLQSGKDSLKLNELMELCTNLQQRVLDLETTKTTQANEIASLKRRAKKLERSDKSRTHRLKRMYKVGSSKRVESSEDEGLGKEDASEQGRINAIDVDEDITLVNDQDDADMFGVNDLDGDEVIVDNVDVVKTAEETRSVVEEVTVVIEKAKLVSAAEETVNAAATTVSTASTIPVSAATTTTTNVQSL
ncbi:hypothetical protein Tco_1352156 [Tanacetum coccineum]